MFPIWRGLFISLKLKGLRERGKEEGSWPTPRGQALRSAGWVKSQAGDLLSDPAH